MARLIQRLSFHRLADFMDDFDSVWTTEPADPPEPSDCSTAPAQAMAQG